jgi:serine/threonine protein phosphatase PrpC
MSYYGNSTQYSLNNNTSIVPQNNQLIYYPINYIYPNITSQSMILNQNNPLNLLSSNNNINKSINSISASDRKNGSNLNKSKISLSSSGILKKSKRDKKYNRVLKNGKKLKNIDLNRDYEEEPENEDDLSSINSSTNLFKNKLSLQNNSLNNNEPEKSILNSKLKNSNSNGNNAINNQQQNSIIKSLKNNNLDEKSHASSHKSNNINNSIKEPLINKAKTQILVPNQQNLNILNTNNTPMIIENGPVENQIYNFDLGGMQEISQSIIFQDENDNNPIPNLGEYMQNETFPQPFYQDEINLNNIINPNQQSKGFKCCSQLTKAGLDGNGQEKTDQDTPMLYLSVADIEGFNIFGVLDGHGNYGHFVSQFCRDYFMNKMKEYAESIMYITQSISAEDVYLNLKQNNYSYIVELFMNIDDELSAQSDIFDCNMSGTTCNLIFQFNNHLVCFNVGDSRSILIEESSDNTNQIIRALSIDHKPDLPEELMRIKENGGMVDQIQDLYGNKLGPNRVFKEGCVYPGLAMSRSLGDFQAKECGVIPTPEIIEYEINPNTKYFVVCSDGVWEFLTNENVRDIGNKYYYNNNDVVGFCNELVNIAVNVWGEREKARDDITVVAVFF